MNKTLTQEQFENIAMKFALTQIARNSSQIFLKEQAFAQYYSQLVQAINKDHPTNESLPYRPCPSKLLYARFVENFNHIKVNDDVYWFIKSDKEKQELANISWLSTDLPQEFYDTQTLSLLGCSDNSELNERNNINVIPPKDIPDISFRLGGIVAENYLKSTKGECNPLEIEEENNFIMNFITKLQSEHDAKTSCGNQKDGQPYM